MEVALKFSEVQIKLMQDTIDDWGKKDSVLWKNAFYYYNLNHLSAVFMSCNNHYRIVLNWVISNNSKETVNIEQ